MTNKELYKLKKKDINKSAEILAKAFSDYPMFRHICGEEHIHENLQVFLRFLTKYTFLYGETYASSSELEGTILYIDFDNYKFNLFRSLRAGVLSLIKIGKNTGRRFNEYGEFSLKLHKKIIKDPHQYLMFIGVDPEKHRRGFGSKLISQLVKTAEEKNQPCYLETHDTKNIAFYKKYGFEVVSEDTVPGTEMIQFAMLKDK